MVLNQSTSHGWSSKYWKFRIIWKFQLLPPILHPKSVACLPSPKDTIRISWPGKDQRLDLDQWITSVEASGFFWGSEIFSGWILDFRKMPGRKKWRPNMFGPKMVMIFHGDSSDGIPVRKKSHKKQHKKYKRNTYKLHWISLHVHGRINITYLFSLLNWNTGWWFQPLWKLLVKVGIFQIGVKIQNIWKHHLEYFFCKVRKKNTHKKRRTPAGNHAVPAEMDLIQDLCSKNKLSCLYRLDRVLGSTRMSCWKLGPMLRIKL